MFGPLGFPEMLFIVVLALLIFGPKRLPEVGRTIGKGMAQFRKATTDLKRTIESEIALEEDPGRRPPGPPRTLKPQRTALIPDRAEPRPERAAEDLSAVPPEADEGQPV
jgi:TatA/E family protein of Tat protein translocase